MVYPSGSKLKKNKIQTSFAKKEDLERKMGGNSATKNYIKRKPEDEVSRMIPPHMRTHYMTNFTSSRTKQNSELENKKVSQDVNGKRKSSLNQNMETDEHYDNYDKYTTGDNPTPPHDSKYSNHLKHDPYYTRGVRLVKNNSYRHLSTLGRVTHQSHHSTLVPVLIKKAPLYFPGLDTYYRNINQQRRVGINVHHEEQEKPRIERLYSQNKHQSIGQTIRSILFRGTPTEETRRIKNQKARRPLVYSTTTRPSISTSFRAPHDYS